VQRKNLYRILISRPLLVRTKNCLEIVVDQDVRLDRVKKKLWFWVDSNDPVACDIVSIMPLSYCQPFVTPRPESLLLPCGVRRAFYAEGGICMRGVFLFVLAAAVAMPIAARAQAKPDFSGSWTLNAEKSDPPPQRGGGGGRGPAGPITIKQTATEFSITSEGRQGPQTLTYKLDGSVSTNPGRGGMEVKSTAKWDGLTLVIETTRDMGGTPITTVEKRHLDNGGKEMVIEQESTGGPNGPTKRKTVFTKG